MWAILCYRKNIENNFNELQEKRFLKKYPLFSVRELVCTYTHACTHIHTEAIFKISALSGNRTQGITVAP